MEAEGSVEEVETQFPGVATAPTTARAFLRAALGTWQLDGFGEVTELLTSELVTNVVRHVGTPMTLRARFDTSASRIRVEVDDPSTDPPVLEHPEPNENHGRGMLFIDTLADAWGTDIRAGGKTVWFELDVSTATGEVHGTS
jgi:anti-sigma regulatory factor (Ser/Thr protein kinase)